MKFTKEELRFLQLAFNFNQHIDLIDQKRPFPEAIKMLSRFLLDNYDIINLSGTPEEGKLTISFGRPDISEADIYTIGAPNRGTKTTHEILSVTNFDKRYILAYIRKNGEAIINFDIKTNTLYFVNLGALFHANVMNRSTKSHQQDVTVKFLLALDHHQKGLNLKFTKKQTGFLELMKAEKENHEKLIQKIMSLTETADAAPKQNIQTIKEKMHDISNQIRELEDKKNRLKMKADEWSLRLLKKPKNDNQENRAKRILKQLARHKNIKTVEIADKGTSLLLHLYPVKMKKYNKQSLNLNDENLYRGSENFKQALKRVFNEEATLYMGRYTIKIDYLTGSGSLKYSLKNTSLMYQNPHHNFSCLGQYESFINEAKKNRDILTLVHILIEYLQSVTFHDTAANHIKNMCYIKDNQTDEIIYDARKE